MKAYLKKLGKTKFQAFLIMTFTNIIMLILFLTKTIDIDGELNKWMPAINITAQMVVTWLYVWVEGGIDKEAQKQQVYVVPGPAAEPMEGVANDDPIIAESNK